MEKLTIEGSSNTPEINFDPNSGELQLSGNSYFHDSPALFEKLIRWIQKYSPTEKNQPSLHIHLDYIDSSSKKGLVEFLKVYVERFSKSGGKVIWHYLQDDTDMLETGKDFSKFLGMDFGFVEEKDQD